MEKGEKESFASASGASGRGDSAAAGGEGAGAPDPGSAGVPPASGPDLSPGGPDPDKSTAARARRALDLPRKFEDFQALVDHAFCAPEPAPAYGEMRQVLDEMGHTLWEFLHVFDREIQQEQQTVVRELPGMREPHRAGGAPGA